MEVTPANEIILDRAMAHPNPMPPITNVFQKANNITSSGPCIVFVGDSYMTVDPILAQGFTLAMEGAYAIKQSIIQSSKSDSLSSSLRSSLLCSHEERMKS